MSEQFTYDSEQFGLREDPSDDELRVWMEDLILDARRFDSLARDARKDNPIAPVTESDATVFRDEAFKSRRQAQGICRYLQSDTDRGESDE